MRISDWSSDVCSSDLVLTVTPAPLTVAANDLNRIYDGTAFAGNGVSYSGFVGGQDASVLGGSLIYGGSAQGAVDAGSYTIEVSGLSSGNYAIRSEEHTSELQSLMRISYAVFCLKKKNENPQAHHSILHIYA